LALIKLYILLVQLSFVYCCVSVSRTCVCSSLVWFIVGSFPARSNQTKDYKTGICINSLIIPRHLEVRAKTGWLVSEWGEMSACGLLFQ